MVHKHRINTNVYLSNWFFPFKQNIFIYLRYVKKESRTRKKSISFNFPHNICYNINKVKVYLLWNVNLSIIFFSILILSRKYSPAVLCVWIFTTKKFNYINLIRYVYQLEWFRAISFFKCCLAFANILNWIAITHPIHSRVWDEDSSLTFL